VCVAFNIEELEQRFEATDERRVTVDTSNYDELGAVVARKFATEEVQRRMLDTVLHFPLRGFAPVVKLWQCCSSQLIKYVSHGVELMTSKLNQGENMENSKTKGHVHRFIAPKQFNAKQATGGFINRHEPFAMHLTKSNLKTSG